MRRGGGGGEDQAGRCGEKRGGEDEEGRWSRSKKKDGG